MTSSVPAFANDNSVLPKGEYSCHTNSPAKKISKNEVYCKLGVFSSNKPSKGLQLGKVYFCKNAKVLPDKSTVNGQTYYELTGKVKCE
jgi:hypothetical protein